jgi:hypothetical protein
MSAVMADIVAKLFLAFERATLIQNQMPMRKVDFKNKPLLILLWRVSYPSPTFATISADIVAKVRNCPVIIFPPKDDLADDWQSL